MATERVVYEADTARLMGALQKVVDKEVQLRNGIKQTKEETKNTENTFAKLGATAGQQLAGMAMGFLSVQSAIATAKQLYSDWNQEMDQAAQKFTKYATNITQAVSGRGDLAHLSQIRAGLEKNASTYGVGMEEAVKAYSAVGGAMPTADWQRVLAVTGKSMESKLAGADVAEFGTMMGELAKMMEEKSMDDLADLAKAATETTGRHGVKFGKAGVKVVEQWLALQLGSAEQGLAYALASFEAGQGGEAALSLVSKLGEQKELENLLGWKERRLPADQQRQRAFYRADAAERLRLIQGDPAMRQTIFGTAAGSVEAMLARDPAAIQSSLAEAQRTNLFERSKRLVGTDAYGGEFTQESQMVAAREQVELAKAKRDQDDQDALQAMEIIMFQEGRFKKTRDIAKVSYKLARRMGAGQKRALEFAGLTEGGTQLVQMAQDNPEDFAAIYGAAPEHTKTTAATPVPTSIVPQQVFPNAQIINFTPGLIPAPQIKPPLAGAMGGNVYD